MLEWKIDEKEMYECLQESVLKLMELFTSNSKSKSKSDSSLALAYRIFIQLIAQKEPGMYS